MKKFWITCTVIAVLIVLVIAGVHVYQVLEEQHIPPGHYDQIVLYYGKECPHCVELEKAMQQEDISEKVKFIKKEVFHNQHNLMDLVKRESVCGMNTHYVEVPVLWTGSKCLVGPRPILQFFREQAREKTK